MRLYYKYSAVLCPLCIELGLCILQFEKHVGVRHLELVRKLRWKNALSL